MKALACELPATLGLPLSRFSRAELRRHVLAAGIVAEISGVTIWRWLREDAIRPWSHRSWIFPRDPDFAAKAGPVLDLYHRRWQGTPLGPRDFVLSADEKTQIQLLSPRHPITPPTAGHPIRVSSDYRRHGTCAYLAAWDVHRAAVFGRVVSTLSIAAFDALVAAVMRRAPYRTARRVFWIVDNGTIHRGQRAVGRLRARWPNLMLVHLPVHASWLNQVEIYFSILQRKALTPGDFATEAAAAERILGFQHHYQTVARPFEWRFTRRDLARLLARCPDSATSTKIAA
ncbi:MAG TPA: transposase [Gemmatimonadaceae bacterium]|nr:transposase [Gemmatimonadaceae bacterium]